MTYDNFIALVQAKGRQQNAPMSWKDAEEAARATLMTLADRLSVGEARDFGAKLPPEAAAFMVTATGAEGFRGEEFTRRIAERAGLEPTVARIRARAVLTAAARAMSEGDLDSVQTELPKDIRPLMEEDARS
jgi:uncharacterized protein (DUF2267 family)